MSFPPLANKIIKKKVLIFANVFFFRQAPKIKPIEQRYTVIQGTDFELICDTTGSPYPTVTWSLVSFSIIIINIRN